MFDDINFSVNHTHAGVGVTYSFKNTQTMVAGLDSIPETTTKVNGSAFFGIMRASELIPYDSAIFISTDSVPLDEHLAQIAAITLLKKRIRVSAIMRIFSKLLKTKKNPKLMQSAHSST